MSVALVVDTSAVIAIMCDEPEGAALRRVMARAEIILLPSSAYLEAGIVLLRRYGDDARAMLDDFLKLGQIEIAPLVYRGQLGPRRICALRQGART